MGVEEGQDGQWTPRGQPKAVPEGPQGVQMVSQGAQMVGQGSQMVGQGAQKDRQREAQYDKKGAKKHI